MNWCKCHVNWSTLIDLCTKSIHFCFTYATWLCFTTKKKGGFNHFSSYVLILYNASDSVLKKCFEMCGNTKEAPTWGLIKATVSISNIMLLFRIVLQECSPKNRWSCFNESTPGVPFIFLCIVKCIFWITAGTLQNPTAFPTKVLNPKSKSHWKIVCAG